MLVIARIMIGLQISWSIHISKRFQGMVRSSSPYLEIKEATLTHSFYIIQMEEIWNERKTIGRTGHFGLGRWLCQVPITMTSFPISVTFFHVFVSHIMTKLQNGWRIHTERFISPYANLIRRPFSISLCKLEVPFCKSES
jgi:hypothetical protein